jgi:hypothetical protein
VFLIEDRLDCVMLNGRLGSENPKYEEFARRSRG